MTRLRVLALFLLFLLTMGAASAPGARQRFAAAQEPWRGRVAPEVLEALASGERAEFIVLLEEQADLAAAREASGKEEKGHLVYQLLSQTARRTQAELLDELRDRGVEFRSYWIANIIWVRGDEGALQAMASAPQVAAVLANPYRRFETPTPVERPATRAPSDVEWNVARIGAPELWALGINGQRAIVGGHDTGYDWEHPALQDKYRGWNGTAAEHDYNWHDAIHSGGGICGADSPEPCDDNGHGTHTMGTMVGDDGMGNQIGVAPGARWIGCRNMDRGVGSPITYSECFQWFVAPTDANGENADPGMAPHVVNNSWACPPSEDCTEATVLQTVVENVRAAGIVVVASAGNSGPECGTVQYPPAIYDAAFSVGATTDSDAIAVFSSRGPVSVDGSNRLKPDVVAPGVEIRSSRPGGVYGELQGTSMAAPHVAGLIALLISANPTLAGNVDAIEAAITGSAVALTAAEDCGGVAGDAVPNNTYGYGRIDAVEAYLRVQLPYRNYVPISVLPEP